ncbi:pyridoxal phosphate-dependent aminotransferase [Pseudoalteromonas tunicata]|uniref:pyridoxal phosphate-dependent aminotransferase n=1 Tax=Pseudoalteromonas tunicata TaxID=314281 RepID=UPI00273ED623|nr:pyridoxal phosphate-dependent aminotransferase [Pseudoalteromonas tunicata]MDP5214721.1 pyridoxal phosphate-dependent aminotransferase [Pseudoalteromonas tunicata]
MKNLFDAENVPLLLLKERAFNFRWAETAPDVIPLTAADPDFRAAPEISRAIAEYALDGVFSYGPHQGLNSFKQALATGLLKRKNYHLFPELILPIDSVASAMYAVARCYLQPGDEAIIFDPVDFLFEQAALAAGASVKRCPFDEQRGAFCFEQLPKLINNRTKLIGVCNPHNPLGLIMSKAELEQLALLAQKHNLIILNDEIWSDIVYPVQQMTSFHHLSNALQQQVVTVYGFSKAFALAGLRVGAIFAPNQAHYQALVNAANVMTTAGGVSTLSQIAATEAILNCWYWVDAFIAHLTHLRDYAVTRLNQMPGIQCRIPAATYLLFPDIRATGLCADEFVKECLKDKLAIVPGNERFFGPAAKGHVRICFATSFSILQQGLDRMETTLIRLGVTSNAV